MGYYSGDGPDDWYFSCQTPFKHFKTGLVGYSDDFGNGQDLNRDLFMIRQVLWPLTGNSKYDYVIVRSAEMLYWALIYFRSQKNFTEGKWIDRCVFTRMYFVTEDNIIIIALGYICIN